MRCVILQPSYIPWRGYFDLIRRADVFVFYDDVQYDTGGWRNRNRIKTAQGPRWLTIPVQHRGAHTHSTAIREIETTGDGWARKHLEALRHSYAKAPHFEMVRPWLERRYRSPPRRLAEFTMGTTIDLAAMLGINTRFVRSSELAVSGRRSDRLIAILQELGADRYLSGPSASTYIDEEGFERAGIGLEWMSYEYPEYPQLYGAFDPFVSVLDLMCMTGGDALEYF